MPYEYRPKEARYEIPALPPHVVEQIWAQIPDERAPLDYGVKRYRDHNEHLQAFVNIAVAPPHYAYAGDIAHALGLRANTVNRYVVRAVLAARLTRST